MPLYITHALNRVQIKLQIQEIFVGVISVLSFSVLECSDLFLDSETSWDDVQNAVENARKQRPFGSNFKQVEV